MRQVVLESTLNPDSRSPSPEPLPHVEEQRALRDETIAAFHEAISEEDEDGLLVLREKTKDEREMEEEEYRAFLEREVGGDLRDLVVGDIPGAEDAQDAEDEDGDKEKAKKKKKKKSKPATDVPPEKSKQESDQEFLMKYVLEAARCLSSNSRLLS